MTTRTAEGKAAEARVRRLAERLGYRLTRPRGRVPGAPEGGVYALRSGATGRLVWGSVEAPPYQSLADVEAYLMAQAGGDRG